MIITLHFIKTKRGKFFMNILQYSKKIIFLMLPINHVVLYSVVRIKEYILFIYITTSNEDNMIHSSFLLPANANTHH